MRGHPVTAGVFNPTARAEIVGLLGGRCAGCGRTDVTCQHRRARGMGGTSDVTKGHPANGVPLCGSGTTGCHGWTESRPGWAIALGWRLTNDQDALTAPFWTELYGWVKWVENEHGIGFDFVLDTDLDDLMSRRGALDQFRHRYDTVNGKGTR